MNKRIKDETQLTPEQEKRERIKTYAQQMNTNIAAALRVRETLLSNFNPERINSYFRDPANYENDLIELSRYIYNVSPQYRAMVNYMSNMPTFAYELDLIGNIDDFAVNKVKQKYLEASQYVDKLNLKHEMNKALNIAYKEDVFYGYEHESKDSYFIQQINPRYCRIESIEDGVFNYAFDFSYFSGKESELANFPVEFREKYQLYKSDTVTNRWIEISHRGVCFKVNNTLPYILPPFSGMFESIFDLDEYKKLKKAKTKMDNFLLLVEQIPVGDGEEMDNFLIDPETAMYFHNQIEKSLPDGVGLATSPMEMKAIRLERNASSQRDTVNDAVSMLYTDSASSQFIFGGGEKTSSVGISKTVMKDEQVILSMMNQIANWLNRKLKKLKGNIKFRVDFVDVTNFSKEEEFERTLKAAQYGVPSITRLGAIQGMSPSQLYNRAMIENEVLGLHEVIRPLSSSHTQTNDADGGGRPEANEGSVTESTESWRESNDSRND